MNLATYLGINNSTGTVTNGVPNIETGLERAAAKANAYEREAQALYQPYTESGAASLDEYIKLLLGGVDSLSGDKNFQDMKDLAERQVMSNRAVSGLLRSGATASALDDTLLKFANTYYDNRLNELKAGVGIGQFGVQGESSIYDKLGGNATDLATALANIQMEREGNKAMIDAANKSADTSKYIAENTGGLFGHGGFLGLGL